MHVCLITSGRVSEVFWGGEERFTISLRNWLVDNGHKVTIIGRKLFGVKVIEHDDVPWARADMELTKPRTLYLPYPLYGLCMSITSLFLVLQVVAINRRTAISVIHAQDTGYGGLSAIILGKILRVPVVISSHGVRHLFLSEFLRGISRTLSLPFEYCLDVFASRSADLVVVVSRSGEEFFAHLGLREGMMRMIPIGIELGRFEVTEESRHIVRRELDVDDDVVVGFVGRLSREKNLFTLVESFTKAFRRADRTKLILVGTGPVEGELRILSHSSGIDEKVIFTGPRYDVDRLLSALDIFVLPSHVEGCPTALLEAMASGRAIIASNIPSIRGIVKHGEEAILVDPNDVEQMKRAMLLLYSDSDLRAKLGRNAKEKAKLYEVDKVYERISNAYKELVHYKAEQETMLLCCHEKHARMPKC